MNMTCTCTCRSVKICFWPTPKQKPAPANPVWFARKMPGEDLTTDNSRLQQQQPNLYSSKLSSVAAAPIIIVAAASSFIPLCSSQFGFNIASPVVEAIPPIAVAAALIAVAAAPIAVAAAIKSPILLFPPPCLILGHGALQQARKRVSAAWPGPLALVATVAAANIPPPLCLPPCGTPVLRPQQQARGWIFGGGAPPTGSRPAGLRPTGPGPKSGLRPTSPRPKRGLRPTGPRPIRPRPARLRPTRPGPLAPSGVVATVILGAPIARVDAPPVAAALVAKGLPKGASLVAVAPTASLDRVAIIIVPV